MGGEPCWLTVRGSFAVAELVRVWKGWEGEFRFVQNLTISVFVEKLRRDKSATVSPPAEMKSEGVAVVVRLIDREATNIQIETVEGREFMIPLETLSEQDRRFLDSFEPGNAD